MKEGRDRAGEEGGGRGRGEGKEGGEKEEGGRKEGGAGEGEKRGREEEKGSREKEGEIYDVFYPRKPSEDGLAERLSLCHDNGDCIVQHTLSKHKHVEGGADIQGMKDGQSGHRIHSRDQSTKCEARERRNGGEQEGGREGRKTREGEEGVGRN